MRQFRKCLAFIAGGLILLVAFSAFYENRTEIQRFPILGKELGEMTRGPDVFSDTALVTMYRPKRSSRTAIIICPGGGYQSLTIGPEGHQVAKWFADNGVVAFVLEYRLPFGRFEVPLLDLQATIRFVRSRAVEWNIQTDRIGLIGFSAGGHLALTAATHIEQNISTSENWLNVSVRPDFVALVYPVVTMGAGTHQGSKLGLLGSSPTNELVERYSNELNVNSYTPPIYLVHAMDDLKVPIETNSEELHRRLVQHDVPHEYLKLSSGGHGLGGYRGEMWDAWKVGLLSWLKSRGYINIGKADKYYVPRDLG